MTTATTNITEPAEFSYIFEYDGRTTDIWQVVSGDDDTPIEGTVLAELYDDGAPDALPSRVYRRFNIADLRLTGHYHGLHQEWEVTKSQS